VKQRKPTTKRRFVSLVAGACLLATASGSSSVLADPYGYGGKGGGGDKNQIQHVLLLSIDGMHALDFLNCSANGTCPNLAALATNGVNYLNTSTSKPSDSFPGLMALVTGGSPRTMGVNYDVAYDRALNPPAADTGNGLLGGSCTPGGTPSGTSTEFDEGININNMPGVFPQAYLNGGAPSGDGGINSIDPTRLERDENCNPVYPWNFIRVNTIFGVIHGAGGYTAWSDKHPSYSSVGGPSGSATDVNLDDYYSPEINSDSADYLDPVHGAFPALIPSGCNPLPDQFAVAADDDYTGSFLNIQCYDGLKVNAILNEIAGKNHDGTAKAPVPNIFGMNFQAVSIGEKLIYKHNGGTPPMPALYSHKGGYTDSIGTPSPSLLQEIEFVDRSIGSMVNELAAQHLLKSTLIIVTAKHGQSPVDSSRYQANGSPNDPASLLGSCLPDSELNQIGPTEDDVALLWLKNSCDAATEVDLLETTLSPVTANVAGIGEIFSGPALALYYNAGDSRAPDILITPNIGVTYSNSTKKLAEHGGFAHDDVNVIMLVSNPSFSAETVTSPVETAQVAPTILKALGLDPYSLQAVQMEHTEVLPGVPLSSH
jgi:type I phosphodiesterase/nucleotide pyrophosphatase